MGLRQLASIVTRITPTGLARRGTRLILSLEPTSTSAESPGNPLQPDSHSERRQQSSINLTPDSTWPRLTYCALRNTDQQNSISGSQNACKSVGIKLPHTLLVYSNNPRAKKWLKRALPDPMLKCKLNIQPYVEVICGPAPEAATRSKALRF